MDTLDLMIQLIFALTALLVRVETVLHARDRAMTDVMAHRAECRACGVEPVHSFDSVLGSKNVFAALLDLRKWTYAQFFPELQA